MKAAVVDAVGAGFKIAEVELARPVGREVLIDVRASAEISLDQIESGYQKLADPEITRVVITRF